MTSFMEPLALRAASALRAVAELCTQWWAMKWYLSASRLPMRLAVSLMVSLTVWAVTGGTRATRSASSRVLASRSARGTTRLTRPSRHASWASMTSPVHRNSLALRIPSSQGSTRSSTAAPVILRTGFWNRASSAATMRSHMAASISPAATQLPWTAAIVGLRKSWIRRQRSKYIVFSWWNSPSGVSRIATHGSEPSPATSAVRSWPDEKCLPAPARITTRTLSSASARSKAASISSISVESCAFATSGRFMVIVATGPST